mgnify:CR=1 FL=1
MRFKDLEDFSELSLLRSILDISVILLCSHYLDPTILDLLSITI